MLIAIMGLSVVASLLPGFGQQALAASTPTAAFNSTDDPATISAIEELLRDNDSGAALGNTEVVVRGGIWGDGTLFHYVRSVDANSRHYGIQYSTSYYCVNGTPQTNPGDSNEGTIKIEASIYAHLGDTYHDDSTIAFDAHVSHITFTPKQVPGQPLNHSKEVSYDPAGRDNSSDSNDIKTNEGLHPGSGVSKIEVNGKNITAGCDITVADTSKPMPNLMSSNTPQAVKEDWAAALRTAGGDNDKPGTTSTGSADAGNSTDDKQLECDGSSSALSWLICPFIDLMTNMVNALDKFITAQLTVKTNAIFCDTGDTCVAYYSAWQSFRNIALGLLAIAGLVMVISQALGMEILDAYTIRKVLPRVLIVAIGITLSWSLMEFFVNFTNDLAFGIRHLIYQPFGSLRNEIDLSFGGAAGSIIGGFTALTLFGVFGLLSFLVTAGLAVLVAFIVLVLRQVAITLLVLIAPIAIIAYVLPNTQRIYKFWWESFSKALLMFPLIAAFIAAGRVFSAIAIHNSSGSGGDANQLIGFAAYFAPYFLIPATFKFAGGALAQLGGFVNDRGRGAFDRLRQFRGGQSQRNLERLRMGTRFEGTVPGTKRLSTLGNEISKGVGTGWKGRFGLGERGALARAYVNQEARDKLLQDPKMQAIKGKNDYNRIIAEGMGDERRGREALLNHLMNGGDDGKTFYTREEAQARVDVAAKAAKAAGAFTKGHAAAAFYNMVRDGTAIRDTDDLARLAAVIGDGDNNNTYTYAAEGASISRQVGRSDLAAASEPIGELAFAHSDLIYDKGLYNGDSTEAGRDLDRLRHAAWASGAGGEVAYTKFSTAKGRTVRNDTRAAVDILKAHRKAVEAGEASPYNAEQVQFAAATLVESQNAIDQNYGKLNNRIDAAREMAKDEGALNWYLDTGTTVNETEQIASNLEDRTPVYATGQRETTNREVIQKIVGDRFNSMTPEQRRIAEANRANEDQDQNH